MIDFRYHLVSLISVFMALAVGIVLGAGPLKEAIGDTLTGEVEDLRARTAELRGQLEVTTADLDQTEAALDASAEGLLDGLLPDRRVALVLVGDVDPEIRDAVVERIEQAGAAVTVRAEVLSTWTDPARRSFRASLAGGLLEFLDPRPAEDAGTEAELAEALVQSLTRPEPTDPHVLAEPAELLLQMLVDAELVAVDEVPDLPADAVLVLTGPTITLEEIQANDAAASADPEGAATTQAERDAFDAAGLAIARASSTRSPVVVASGELTEPSVVRTIREDGDLVDVITTVDAVNTLAGQIAVPLALGAHMSGTTDHYGIGAGAVGPMPQRVRLDPPMRVPEVIVGPNGEDEGPEGDGDAADEDTGTSDGDAG